MTLDDVGYHDGAMRFTGHRHRAPESALAGYLEEARAVLGEPPPPIDRAAHVEGGADFEHLRWFWLPEEIAARV
jgi:hypothetical protein